MIAFVEEAMRMSITYRQNNWVKLLPKIQFAINSTPSKATSLSPLYVEKGRHDVTNLDRDNILRRGDSTNPDIDEFVAGIHNIEQQVRERVELTRRWMERDADKRRRNISASLHPGAYAYLSTKGITMPVDKERTSTKLRQLYYGPYKILRQLSPVSIFNVYIYYYYSTTTFRRLIHTCSTIIKRTMFECTSRAPFGSWDMLCMFRPRWRIVYTRSLQCIGGDITLCTLILHCVQWTPLGSDITLCILTLYCVRWISLGGDITLCALILYCVH
jgi:hypothetical protein